MKILQDGSSAENLRNLHKILSDDVVKVCQDLRSNSKDQTMRRALMRTLFAHIEGTIYGLKQYLLECDSRLIRRLNPMQISILREESVDLLETGELRVRSANLRLKPNLRFALHTFSELFGMGLSLDVSGKGWEALGDAIKVRDRITHPKSPESMTIGDAEIESALAAFTWFAHALGERLSSLEKIQAQITKFLATGKKPTQSEFRRAVKAAINKPPSVAKRVA